MTFTTRPKIKSQSQIFRLAEAYFCLPHQPNFSDFFYLCRHRVSVVRDYNLTSMVMEAVKGQKLYCEHRLWHSMFGSSHSATSPILEQDLRS
jgi:hypothetical protein